MRSHIQVVELRHSFGSIVDENQNPLLPEEELNIIENIVHHIQSDHPDFKTKIIVTGFKFLGSEHASRALDILKECC